MAPAVLEDESVYSIPIHAKKVALGQSTQALDSLDHVDLTPVIGREFGSANIVDDILNASNSDELLKQLAITISRRGVVFFRKQNNLTNDKQKDFIQKLGELSGKPSSSTLHIHPVLNDSRELGGSDAEISTISSVDHKKLFGPIQKENKRKVDAANGWHSDIQFEPVPADYTSLRLIQLPRTGGDTLWASGYEIYDRFSAPYQKFLEGLTATFTGDGFKKVVEKAGTSLHEGPRGSPDNVGTELSAVHPVVRTNPVTGWKSIFPVGPFPKRINEVSQQESDDLLRKFQETIVYNHDLQVRLKWQNENDIGKSNHNADLSSNRPRMLTR